MVVAGVVFVSDTANLLIGIRILLSCKWFLLMYTHAHTSYW